MVCVCVCVCVCVDLKNKRFKKENTISSGLCPVLVTACTHHVQGHPEWEQTHHFTLTDSYMFVPQRQGSEREGWSVFIGSWVVRRIAVTKIDIHTTIFVKTKEIFDCVLGFGEKGT